ncbi:MAG: putative amidohydrolase YtcJ [Porticoccus sp.]|jgi:predicted amidohydrolase YtcJ
MLSVMQRYALDAFEAALKSNGRRDSRHLTANTQVVNPADADRLAQLDVIAGFSPYWTYADAYIADINPSQLGEKRIQQMYPIRSILDSGVRIAFGSDGSSATRDRSSSDSYRARRRAYPSIYSIRENNS